MCVAMTAIVFFMSHRVIAMIAFPWVQIYIHMYYIFYIHRIVVVYIHVVKEVVSFRGLAHLMGVACKWILAEAHCSRSAGWIHLWKLQLLAAVAQIHCRTSTEPLKSNKNGKQITVICCWVSDMRKSLVMIVGHQTLSQNNDSDQTLTISRLLFHYFVQEANEIWYPGRAVIKLLRYQISLTSCTKWRNDEWLNVSVWSNYFSGKCLNQTGNCMMCFRH